MDRRYQDVAGPVVAQLHDQLGQVGLDGGDALGLEMFVEADLLGGHRLDLDHFVCTGRPDQFGDNAIGLLGVAGPVHHPAVFGDVALQLLQQFGQPRQHLLFDGTAGQSQLLPVRALRHRRSTFRPD